MAHKYNKIDKEDVLVLFETTTVVRRVDVCRAYGCSVYSVINAIDYLVDLGEIRLSNRGYKLV
jgi:hypothetical protein